MYGNIVDPSISSFLCFIIFFLSLFHQRMLWYTCSFPPKYQPTTTTARLMDIGVLRFCPDSSLKSQPPLFTCVHRVQTGHLYIIQNCDDKYHHLWFYSTEQIIKSYILAPVVPHWTTYLLDNTPPPMSISLTTACLKKLKPTTLPQTLHTTQTMNITMV